MLRFDPFSDMDAWTRGMMTGSAAGTARTPRFMPLDLYKVEDHYLLIADLPGADPGSDGLALPRAAVARADDAGADNARGAGHGARCGTDDAGHSPGCRHDDAARGRPLRCEQPRRATEQRAGSDETFGQPEADPRV